MTGGTPPAGSDELSVARQLRAAYDKLLAHALATRVDTSAARLALLQAANLLEEGELVDQAARLRVIFAAGQLIGQLAKEGLLS